MVEDKDRERRERDRQTDRHRVGRWGMKDTGHKQGKGERERTEARDTGTD